MSLQFVFGPAGSGKSTYVQKLVIEEAQKNPRDSFLLIVPDQFTMQTQMDIVKRHPNKGILNIDVLSFSRLSYRVFSETGKSETPVLDDTGKSLVLRRLSSDVSGKMPYIGKNLNKIGYIHEVKSSISEFMQYGLSVKDVYKLSQSVKSGLLKAKISDLAVIYEAFMDFNKDRFVTSEETLDMLKERLKYADFIKGSTVVFDGFTGFTPIQERVVVELCKLCKRVIITFDLSLPEKYSDVGGEEKLFYLSRRSAKRLSTKASDEGVLTDEPVILDSAKGRFSLNPELAHLEANLFRYPFTAYEGKPESVNIFSAEDVEAEVSEIALRIHELVRTKGYAYRDIAVVCGNLEAYAPSFETRMRELEMPVFIDRTNAIALNPFTEYLKSALLILVKDFSYDSVFHYLRSGFTGFSNDEIDRFDRYVSSLNIRGAAVYKKPFTKRERGLFDSEAAALELSKHEDMRKRLVSELSVLGKKNATAGTYAKNLYEFLKNNHSFEKLKEYEAYFEAENDLPKAKEYGQIYRCIMELLDTIVSLIGDEEMSIDEFYGIFEAGINEIEVGTIPRNVDRIVIGDVERTRIGKVRALFFAGVNDGNIPKASSKGGIFTEAERETIRGLDFDLAPTPREEMYTQKLYLYMNLCKPSDEITISYCGTDVEGKGQRPSYLVETVKKLFPELKVVKPSQDFSADQIVTVKDSLRYYAQFLREYVTGNFSDSEEKLLCALSNIYADEGNKTGDSITDAAFREYVATPLSGRIAGLLYGLVIKASISRMEMYAGCAYAHFLKYGMQLKKNAEYNFEATDLGTIYHGVLDCFSAKLEKLGLNWKSFSPDEGNELIRQAVRDYCENYEQGMLLTDEESMYAVNKITKIMERTVSMLRFHVDMGKFLPVKHEYVFERSIPLDDGSEMLLNGKIDRIDVYESDSKIYVKILDYKSGSREIDVTNIYHGIEQQLAVYMSEAVYRERELHPQKEVIPSALLYYTIDDPMISSDSDISDEDIEREIKKKLRVEGIFEGSDENITSYDDGTGEPGMVIPVSYKKDGSFTSASAKRIASREEMENMLNYVNRMTKSIGSRIVAGDKKISPMRGEGADACKYCDFKSVCRFDEKIPGLKARDGKEKDEETVRNIVMGGAGDGLYLFD